MEDYPSLAEGNGLENRQACKSVRGFESHILLRQPIYWLSYPSSSYMKISLDGPPMVGFSCYY